MAIGDRSSRPSALDRLQSQAGKTAKNWRLRPQDIRKDVNKMASVAGINLDAQGGSRSSPATAAGSVGTTTTAEVERGDIPDYLADYRDCPLVSKPIDVFASDVVSPGYRIEAEPDGLEADLENWLRTCAVTASTPGRDFLDLLEAGVRDLKLRGTMVCEHVYADRSTRDQIASLRLLQAETLTAHYHPLTGILYGPGDSPVEPESVAGAGGVLSGVTFSDKQEASVPETAAGNTAAFSQQPGSLDDTPSTISAADDSANTIAFALDDITKLENNADTGAVFGESDVQPVHPRVQGLLQKTADVDTAINAKAYSFWLFKMGDSDAPWPAEAANEFMSSQDPDNYGPGQKTAVPGDVTVETISGDVPEIWPSLEYDVEFILSKMPAPKYRVAFSEDLNRDVAIRLQQDYFGDVRQMRQRLSSRFHPILERKAIELGYGSAEDPPQFELVIESSNPNPLRTEWFSGQQFGQLAAGLSNLGVELSRDEILSMFLEVSDRDVSRSTGSGDRAEGTADGDGESGQIESDSESGDDSAEAAAALSAAKSTNSTLDRWIRARREQRRRELGIDTGAPASAD